MPARASGALGGFTRALGYSDNKVTSDFAACMTRDELKTAVFHDVAVLPHPKETILRAIEREILREQLAARLEWLKRGAAFLPCFQRDHAGSL